MRAEVCDIAPSDWRILPIKDVCERVTSGGTPSRRKPEFFQGGRWGWVKTQELRDRWIDDSEEHITDDAIRESSAKVLPANTVLLALYGATVGQLGLLRRQMTCNQACCAIIADASKADFRYLYYHLLNARPQLKRLATGAAQQNLSGELIRQFELPFPLPQEQRAIAAVLGSLDDKIEVNRKTARALEGIARAVFNSWFVDFDPVRRKAAGEPTGLPDEVAALFPDRLVDSAMGEAPEGWRVGTVGDIAEAAREGVDPGDIDPGTPYIGLEHMPRRSIALAEWAHAGKVTSGKSQFRHGQILFGKLRPYFHKVGIAPVDGVCSTDIIVAEPKQPCWAALALGHLSSLAVVQHADRSSSGTKMPRTNWRDLAAFRIAIPPEPLAILASNTVAPMVDRIVTGIHQNRTLAALRDALLPKLLSGELEVLGGEAAVEEVA